MMNTPFDSTLQITTQPEALLIAQQLQYQMNQWMAFILEYRPSINMLLHVPKQHISETTWPCHPVISAASEIRLICTTACNMELSLSRYTDVSKIY